MEPPKPVDPTEKVEKSFSSRIKTQMVDTLHAALRSYLGPPLPRLSGARQWELEVRFGLPPRRPFTPGIPISLFEALQYWLEKERRTPLLDRTETQELRRGRVRWRKKENGWERMCKKKILHRDFGLPFPETRIQVRFALSQEEPFQGVEEKPNAHIWYTKRRSRYAWNLFSLDLTVVEISFDLEKRPKRERWKHEVELEFLQEENETCPSGVDFCAVLVQEARNVASLLSTFYTRSQPTEGR